MNKIIFILGFFIFTSCASDQNINDDNVIARVGDTYLYKDVLSSEIPQGFSEVDSLSFLSKYVTNWIKDQLVLQKAEILLPEKAKNVQKKLKKYRTSLLTYEYEQMYIEKRLDTFINSNEIAEYYNNHEDDFVLKDYIVKYLYLKINKDTPGQNKIKTAYLLRNKEDENQLRIYAQKYAIQFYFNPDKWNYYDDLTKIIPLQDVNKSKFIERKRKLSFEEDEFIYYINIYDYRIKDGISPLSFEKEKIKSIILNMRANELRKKLRSDLYHDAQKNKTIENHIND